MQKLTEKTNWRGERKKETLTFHDGLYDYEGINAFLQAHTGFVEPHAERKERVSQLYFNVTPFLAVVLTAKDHELDLTDEGFASLVGFEKRILEDGTNFTGKMIPDITRGVDWIFFHCDILARRANDVASDVLYSLSTADLQISYHFKKEPRLHEYHPDSCEQIPDRLYEDGQRQTK